MGLGSWGGGDGSCQDEGWLCRARLRFFLEISGQLSGTGPAGAFVLAFVPIRKSSYAGRVWSRRPHCFKPLHDTAYYRPLLGAPLHAGDFVGHLTERNPLYNSERATTHSYLHSAQTCGTPFHFGERGLSPTLGPALVLSFKEI